MCVPSRSSSSTTAMARVSLRDFDALGGSALLLAETEDGEDAVESGFDDAAETDEQEDDDCSDDSDDDSGNGATAQSAAAVVLCDGEGGADCGSGGQESSSGSDGRNSGCGRDSSAGGLDWSGQAVGWHGRHICHTGIPRGGFLDARTCRSTHLKAGATVDTARCLAQAGIADSWRSLRWCRRSYVDLSRRGTCVRARS